MCGRYLLNVDVEEILKHYGLVRDWYTNNWTTKWTPEVFPSNTVPVVINRNVKALVPMKWGFSAPNGKGLIINSRGETVDSRPMFRRAFRQKRCLVPANAFFEWRKAGKFSTKFQIRMKQLSLFSLAGIYEDFTDKEGNAYNAFSILTTAPNPLVSRIHDRMPVILSREHEDIWLEAGPQDVTMLKALIRSYDEKEMIMEEV